MEDYILVKIDKDDALDMLMNRLSDRWTDDDDVYELYEEMYRNYLDEGVFNGREFNVDVIVDNDYVNYCDVIDSTDERYDDCVLAYGADDLDFSESSEYSTSGYIEAHKDLDNGEHLFLVRQG